MSVVHEILAGCAALASMAFAAVGVGIIVWQVFSFLSLGQWHAVSLIDAGTAALGWAWFAQPQEWLGAHWLLDQIPASVLALVMWIILAASAGDV